MKNEKLHGARPKQVEIVMPSVADLVTTSRKDQLDNNYKYHTATSAHKAKYNTIRSEARALAQVIEDLCPDGREKSLAHTKLEEAVMWANASIARND